MIFARRTALGSLLLAVSLAACTTSGTPNPAASKASPELAARYNTELALAYMRQGRMDLAQQKLADALKQAPHLAIVHNGLALYYERVGEPDKADSQYRLSLQDHPDDPNTLNNYGAFLCRQGSYQRSLQYFARAAANLSYDTPDAALANAGLCALKIPDKTAAQGYFKRALSINPDLSTALWQLGLLEFEAGNYSSANDYLGRLISTESNPGPQELWVAIETAWTIGDRTTAKRYGRELLKLYPDSQEARKFIKLLGGGQ